MPSWLDLDSDEEILHVTNPSVWRTIPAVAIGGLFAILGVAFIVGLDFSAIDLNYTALGAGLIVMGVTVPILREIRRRSVVYVVTDKQIMKKTGILAQHTDPIPHTRIVDYSVERSPIDRALSKGDIRIATAGTDGDDVLFFDLPDCMSVKATLNRKVKLGSPQGGTTAPTV